MRGAARRDRGERGRTAVTVEAAERSHEPSGHSWALWVVSSPGLPPGQVSVFPLNRSLQIGRDADLSLSDEKLSRTHCSVYSTAAGGHSIKDLASRNGTFVNGRRVDTERLRPCSVIRTGDSVLVYNRRPPKGAVLAAPMVGVSAAMLELGHAIERIAPTELSLLVQGETGTGKELVAHAVHLRSGRRGPILAINAAAIPANLFESELFGYMRGAIAGAVADSKGLFVSAARGTLFLDEIGELSPDLQVKLLRAIERRSVRPLGGTRESPIDVRIVAATSVSLGAGVDKGTFRGDLFARLAEATIEIAPLRERPEDVHPLARAFLAECLPEALQPVFDAGLVEALLLHPWTFNVRELRSLVRRVAALHPGVSSWNARLLPPEVQQSFRNRGSDSPRFAARPPSPGEPSEAGLRALLVRHRGNIRTLANELGKDRTQIYRWLHRYGLRPGTFRTR
jgi:DNA-binding NtrC family response regulator